jgi:hypothetical protein
MNILDLNIHSETFFAELLNNLYGLNFRNLNIAVQNVEAIDLIDKEHKVVAQVSATCTKEKLENSLQKMVSEEYEGYRFIFISIAKDADSLRKGSFATPDNILFDPLEDIIDVGSMLRTMIGTPIDMQRALYEFIKKELGDEIDIVRVESNLAAIINILSLEDLGDAIESPELNAFQIENKIDFNDLNSVRDDINDYKVYYHKLDGLYSAFDKEGVNKSLSVFHAIRKQYKVALKSESNAQDVFDFIVSAVIDTIVTSKNYVEIPYEELEMCVHILVVDAFIRCKIFNNPEGYNHVVA